MDRTLLTLSRFDSHNYSQEKVGRIQARKVVQKGNDQMLQVKESNSASSCGKKCCGREIQIEFELLLFSWDCVRPKQLIKAVASYVYKSHLS
jgi:hypothetical protein